jgi:hypothetical protein
VKLPEKSLSYVNAISTEGEFGSTSQVLCPGKKQCDAVLGGFLNPDIPLKNSNSEF